MNSKADGSVPTPTPVSREPSIRSLSEVVTDRIQTTSNVLPRSSTPAAMRRTDVSTVINVAAINAPPRPTDVSSQPFAVVVDDEAPNRRIMQRLFAKMRWSNVQLLSDGQQLIDLVASGAQPDVVLCDIQMDHVGGLEAMKRISALCKTSGRPVPRTVAVTGSVHPTTVARMREWRWRGLLSLLCACVPDAVIACVAVCTTGTAGFSGLVAKPFTRKSVSKALQALGLSRNKVQPPAEVPWFIMDESNKGVLECDEVV